MPGMPYAEFFGHKISRLILGGNPFSGHSHVNGEMSGEMMDYYTTDNIKKAIIHAQECGVNTIQVRGDAHILRILRELKNEGKMPMWVAQTASEFANLGQNLRMIMAAQPIAVYHHGTVTDNLFAAGKREELRDRLKMIRDTGAPTGLGTHMPDVIDYAQQHGWDVDFYMACVYNISQTRREQPYEGEPFFESDVPIMLKTIAQVDKPCLAFKILGATRRCASPQTVTTAFKQAFDSIKPNDAVVVGMFQKYTDQIALNCDIVRNTAGQRSIHCRQ